jgi:hypothetical protein
MNQKATSEDWPRVVLSIPVERNVSSMAFWNFLSIARTGIPIMASPYSGRVDRTRNIMASSLLGSNFTHLLMLDSDHAHPVDIVPRLVRHVVADPSRLVVSGLNFRRGEPFDPCCWIMGDDGKPYAPAEWDQGLVRVDVCGAGSMLVAREVFEQLPFPWFYHDYSKVPEEWPGEDVMFSIACMEHGIDIWVDTTTQSPHLLEVGIAEGTYRNYLARQEAEGDKKLWMVDEDTYDERGGVISGNLKEQPKRVKAPPIETRVEV